MNFGSILCIAFMGVFSIVSFSNVENLAFLLLCNGTIQLTLFTLVACIPFLRTGRMSYVDIAWPFGVALIGLQILLLGDGNAVRTTIVGGVYLLIGLRMGLGALTMAKATGVIFKTEFPRYTYRRMELEKSGERRMRFYMLAEILAQGIANMTVLAIPGLMMAVNGAAAISGWEVAGIALWFTAYALESTADLQKLKFMSNNRGGVCNVGLWRFSRHPNYFAEWLVWTGLVIASVPSWLALQSVEPLYLWVTLGVAALAASAMMYTTLVYLTGAIPSEYYSVRKRPEYKNYQAKTNMFFPWFPRK